VKFVCDKRGFGANLLVDREVVWTIWLWWKTLQWQIFCVRNR